MSSADAQELFAFGADVARIGEPAIDDSRHIYRIIEGFRASCS